MREILFRGQTRRRGEKVKMNGEPVESNWVYGGIFPTDNGDRAIIYQQEPEIKKYPVYADTVGQYTGVKDRNGNKVFEGDIVEFGRDKYYVCYSEVTASFNMCGKKPSLKIHRPLTIIGNIYDNPKLMEEEE